MAIFKCKMCGGTIEFNQGDTVGICDSCGTKQTLPRLDDDKKANLYDRANHFRRNNDYDKAMGIYEQILNEDNTDSEAYWSLVLCRYGIEYVEDPATHKRVPTVNRAQFTSIFDDDNYKQALHYADSSQRVIYEQEATVINEIQKGILAISQKEDPFDVFICYKETDNNGRRTQDSVLANDLYHQLTQEGFKVFFSRITLEDKLGTAYEPYIFAALNSAKVMVVIGTRPEYFNAVWVKNEWSRFLALVKNNSNKVLIPAYRDMDPYDLPEEFSHLQAQDMSKLGFMQDLIRGIKKITDGNTGVSKSVNKEVSAASTGNANTDSLLKRVFMFLEDGNWSEADAYCEKVLDIEPENAEAYLGKLMAELEVTKREKLADMPESIKDKNNFIKAVRFGDDKLKAELDGYEEAIENNRKQGIYNRAKDMMEAASDEDEYKAAAYEFETILSFKDSEALAKECHEKAAEKHRRNNELIESIIAVLSGTKVKKVIQNLKDELQLLNELYASFSEVEAEREVLLSQKQKIETELKELKNTRAHLGIFAAKEKKNIDAKIMENEIAGDELNKKVDMCNAKFKGYISKEQVEERLSEVAREVEMREKNIPQNILGMSMAEAKKQFSASENIRKAVLKKNPELNNAITIKGEIVEFGLYPKKNGEQKEPISWIVLENRDGKALLLSEKAIDCKSYNEIRKEVTWEECTLRKWLNEEFLEVAFDEYEQGLIVETTLSNVDNKECIEFGSRGTIGGRDTIDKIFLLSLDEVREYFSTNNARKCEATEYAAVKGAYIADDGGCWWWLRSPGYFQDYAAYIYNDGDVRNDGRSVDGKGEFLGPDGYVTVGNNTIRPALWIIDL